MELPRRSEVREFVNGRDLGAMPTALRGHGSTLAFRDVAISILDIMTDVTGNDLRGDDRETPKNVQALQRAWSRPRTHLFVLSSAAVLKQGPELHVVDRCP